MKVLKALEQTRKHLSSKSKTDKNVELVRVAMHEVSPITIQELVDDLNTSFGSVQSNISENLAIRSVSAKCIPKVLTADQNDPAHKRHSSISGF